MERKPDLIVVRGAGAPDAFASIAVANAVYAASAENREISLFQARTGRGGRTGGAAFVQNPSMLAYSEMGNHFRYVFGYNNARSSQVIMQEAEKSNLVFFFGYCLVEEEMEQLLAINPNVYVFDYHSNQLHPRVRKNLRMYQHDPEKCAAQFAWDFFVPALAGQYPLLINEVAYSIFNNKLRGRELFFGLTAAPFQAMHWVKLLGSAMQTEIRHIIERGRFFIEFHQVLQSQYLDSATIVRFEGGQAIQKQGLTKNERSDSTLVVYMFQCPQPSAHYFMRNIKDLPIAKRSIIITYNHHIRERLYHYAVASNCEPTAQEIVGHDADNDQCISRNGAFLNGQGWFTTNVKPTTLLNHVVNRIPTLTSDPE